jgi:hypothetical protein
LAASPMSRSVSVKATYEGVVRLPWSFAMISTRSFCQIPTQLRRADEEESMLVKGLSGLLGPWAGYL